MSSTSGGGQHGRRSDEPRVDALNDLGGVIGGNCGRCAHSVRVGNWPSEGEKAAWDALIEVRRSSGKIIQAFKDLAY